MVWLRSSNCVLLEGMKGVDFIEYFYYFGPFLVPIKKIAYYLIKFSDCIIIQGKIVS